jgi:aminopeptidase N
MMAAMLALIVLLATSVTQVNPDPDAGISEGLARERAARISNLRYDLAFTIPAARSQPIGGRVVIRFTLTPPPIPDPRSPIPDPLVLDYLPDRAGTLQSVEANGVATAVRQVNGHIIVPAGAVRAGENSLTITFNAGDTPLNRSDEFLYTIFVPARAHQAFPCFDQPDLKARWSLALDVPEGWQAVGNGAELERASAGGRTRLRFSETQPVSTYLFAFAAGRFSVEQAERDGRTFRMFHRETDAAKVARNREAIFDLHASSLDWLEKYTAIPYPFGKFDFVAVPAFQFGGMEHPGSIFYNANGLLLDESATQDQMLGRASVIAHETAHMWFGDLVTMRWFNDVWMKEVFANHMAAKIVNPAFPAVNHDLRYLLSYFPQAYDVDRTAGTNEIRQQLGNLNEAGTLYGAIIYQKAPIVMRQLEALLGSDTFRDGLREYLKAHSFANATWADLIALLDGRTPEDLASWSRAWVEERGRPAIKTELTLSGGRITSLAFTQRDPYPARGLVWNQRIKVAVGGRAADDIKLLPVQLNAARVEVPEARGLPAEFVLPNGGGIAYGEFHLDPASLRWLTTNLPSIKDELTRGSAWVTLYDAMLAAEMTPDAFLSLTLRALPLEKNELNISRILSYLREAYWRYLSPDDRTRLAPRVELVLRLGLDGAPSTSLKSVWFSALRDTAQTAPTLEYLTRVWKEEEKVPGLTLAETDFIRLAQDLAVRGGPGAAGILDQQFERIKNPDRKLQFAFVRPSISGELRDRDAWFASLADAANRRREPWVLEGLRYLHHPLRSAAAEKHIDASLVLLREIQRTGDIFFPKRWMDTTLSGHQSAAAAATVRAFVERLPPDYPERLRKVILSSADDLFRASGGK